MTLLHYWTLISFSLVITTSPYWSILPSLEFLPIALILLVISTKFRQVRGLLGLALACVVILIHGNLLRYQTETLFQAGRDITIIADAESLFKSINFGFQGIVTLKAINGEELTWLQRSKIRLNSPIALQPGEQISAKIRLKPIYGLLNDVGFDAEKHALSQGVVAIGTLSNTSRYLIVSKPSMRAKLIKQIGEKTAQLEHQAMIFALMFGLRDDISAQVWQQLKQSGLSHLVAISGLHIGIAFGIGWSLGLIALRIHPQFCYAPIFCGLTLALSYSWLAGFAIPTQRAVAMCVLMCLLIGRVGYIPNLFKWLLVLSILLILDPFAVVSPSLWMSMLAVGIIFLYQAKGKKRTNKLVQAVEMQLFLVILMSPVVAYFFHGISLGAVVYNLLFVPWFSLVVIPAVFISLASFFVMPWLELPWVLLDMSLKPAYWAMQFSTSSWLDISRQTLLWLVLFIALWAVSRLVARRYVYFLGLCASLSFIDWRTSPLWQITLLDVGHGLSIVVRQGDRALLYDTGAAWQTSSIAEQIITPFMQAQGIEQLDYLVISHFDNDHAGGFKAIKSRWQPLKIISSQTDQSTAPCVAGQKWQWQEIRITALWPPKTAPRAYNPHSCVIKLKHQHSETTLLLTGDIETVAEWMLVREGDLNSTLLIVPHHGSKTSSIGDFVAAVNPEVAAASLAKGGRWRLPDKNVVKRYQQIGAKWLDTGQFGQILFEIYPHTYQLSTLRQSKGNTWYRQMLRNRVE